MLTKLLLVTNHILLAGGARCRYRCCYCRPRFWYSVKYAIIRVRTRRNPSLESSSLSMQIIAVYAIRKHRKRGWQHQRWMRHLVAVCWITKHQKRLCLRCCSYRKERSLYTFMCCQRLHTSDWEKHRSSCSNSFVRAFWPTSTSPNGVTCAPPVVNSSTFA